MYKFTDGTKGECLQNDECYLTIGSTNTCTKNICKNSNSKLNCVAPNKFEGVYRFPKWVKSKGKDCSGRNIPSCYAQTFWLQPSCLSTYNKVMPPDKPIEFTWNESNTSICNAQRYNTKSKKYVDLNKYGDKDTADYMSLGQGGYENRQNWGDWQTHGCRFPWSHLPSPHCSGNDEWYVARHETCSWFASLF